MKNRKNIVTIILIVVITSMAVAYSEFATQLQINGNAEITGQWDVKIIGIEAKDVSEGCNAGTPEYTNTTAKFNAKLNKPGDKISYEITIKNAGTIDAIRNECKFTSDEEHGSSAIIYSNTEPSETLLAGEQTTVTITITYDESVTEMPEIKTKSVTGIIEYVQK